MKNVVYSYLFEDGHLKPVVMRFQREQFLLKLVKFLKHY
jgi:hypothetical protein